MAAISKSGVWVAVAGAAVLLSACGQGGGQTAAQDPRQVCLGTLDPAKGVEACRTAMEASPDDVAVRKRLALLRLKAFSLAAARQEYQVALAKAPNDAEAEFGVGLALETAGEQDGALKKLDAARKDPSVIDTFRKYGFPDVALMTFDTPPLVVDGQSPEADKGMTPQRPLTGALTVYVRCQAALNGKLHDCATINQVPPDKADFARAAEKIFTTTRVRPAKNEGKPVADAPIVLTYVFWPENQPQK